MMKKILKKILKIVKIVLTVFGSVLVYMWLAFRVHDIFVYHEFFRPSEIAFTWSEYAVATFIGSVLGIIFGIGAAIYIVKGSSNKKN